MTGLPIRVVIAEDQALVPGALGALLTLEKDILSSGKRWRARTRWRKSDDFVHLLMGTGPGITKLQIPNTHITIDFGGTAEGNTLARREAWIATKRFLASI